MPMLQSMLGGIFSAMGTVRANGGAILHGDRWAESKNPLLSFNDTDSAGDGTCWVWFNGTFVRGADHFEIGGSNYGLARWDFATSEWVAMGTANGPIAQALLAWKGKCYVSWTSGTERVQAIHIDWSLNGIGFNADVGAAQVRRMIAFDFDPTAPDERIVFIGSGFSTSGGKNAYLRTWDGSSYIDIGGPTTVGGNILRGSCIHDFGDGEDVLCVSGKFGTIGATSGYGNVAYYRPSDVTWYKIGAAGLSIPGGSAGVSALASYNGRLWATREDPSSTLTALAAIANSGGDWREAVDFIKNLDAPSFWQYSGTSEVAASGLTLEVYAGRLHVGGNFQFRGLRRGGSATGAITYWPGRSTCDATAAIQRALPFVKGSVSALCIYDGKLIFGGDCRYTIGTTTHRYLGAWTDPGNPTLEGTLEALGGGVNGLVRAACVWNVGGSDKLVVAGDFTMAGTTPVKGIAIWNGSAWDYVVNVSDYGRIYAMIEFDGDLIIAGDFAKVDGAPENKIICVVTPSGSDFVADPVLTDIAADAGDDELIVLALYVDSDGDLFIGGEFNDIDDGFGLTAMDRVAYTTGAGGGWAWNALADDTAQGITGGSVFSIGELEFSGDKWIFFGCDPSAKGGEITSPDPLWRWCKALAGTDPAWVNAESGLVGFGEPIQAIANLAALTEIAYSVFGHAGGSEGAQYRIRDDKVGCSKAWIGEGTGGQAYSAQPSCMVWGDAGDGVKLYIGNERGSLGNLGTESSGPAMMICAVNQDDEIVDVAGGVGVAGFYDFAVQTQEMTDLHSEICSDDGRDEVQTAVVAGTPDGTGKLTATVTDHKGNDVETADIDDDATWATVLANINAGLDAALGVGRVVAGGTGWGDLTFTYSGLGYTTHNRPMIRLNVDKVKIVVSGTPTAGTFGPITIKRDGEDPVETDPIDFADGWQSQLDNINEALEAAVGSYCRAEGEDWDAIYLIHADTLHDTPECDVSSLTGASGVVVETTRLEGATAVSVTRTTRVPFPRLLCSGVFPSTSRAYGQWICGIDIAGRMVPVAEGLGGAYDSSTHRRPYDIRCIPAARFPAEWADTDYSDLAEGCQPDYKWVWLIVGNHTEGRNGAWVRAEDSHIQPIVVQPGIACYDGVRYFRDIGIISNPNGQFLQAVECHDSGGGNQLVVAGDAPPHFFNYATGLWEYFIDVGDAGSMGQDFGAGTVNCLVQKMLSWNGALHIVGLFRFTGSATDRQYSVWNGSAFTQLTPTGFSEANKQLNDAVIANIDGTERLYACGEANTSTPGCPVISTADGASFSAVGGASQLRGEGLALAVVGTGPTKILVCTGNLQVDEGGGFIDCKIAVWNGSAWSIGAHFDAGFSGPAQKSAVGDWHGRQDCERQFSRVIFGGIFVEIAQESGDIGTVGSEWAASLGTIKHTDHGQAAPLDLGGINGVVTAAGSAGAEVWG